MILTECLHQNSGCLGTPPALKGELQRKLVWEDQVYSDIIQQAFTNSFYNLTLKRLLQFNWANTFCPHGKLVVTSADDTFIHMPNLTESNHGLEETGVQNFGLVMLILVPLPLGLKASNSTFALK
jgi:hypothetical protein